MLPGRLGIGVSPRALDALGNTVRGIAVCRELSQDLAVHLVRPGERPAPPVRAVYSPAERASKRIRTPAHRAALRAAASRAVVVELQGELGFSAGEALARCVEAPVDAPDLVVVDLSRVLRADAGGARFIVSLAERIEGRGGRLALTPGGGVAGAALAALPAGVAIFADLDLALEWCEDELLARAGEQPAATDVPIADHELLAGLTAAELERVELELGSVVAAPGTLLVRQGDAALGGLPRHPRHAQRGRDGPDGRSLRLTTLSAGGTFGELAFVDRGVRAADVRADSEVACRTLRYAAIDALAASDPALHGKLLRNLLGVVVATVGRAQADVSRLAG